MNRSILMTVAGLALAGFSAAPMAEMNPLSEQALGGVSAQGYVLTVGSKSFAAPFAYDVYASKAPAPLVTTGQNLVSTFAPGYPAKVAMVRSTGVGKVNTGLSLATSSLQAIPIVGGFVPSVVLSTAP
ncbi:MAG TPA: hypothetical protein VNK45_06895 [Candidatus Acidoferrales bacterium]|nr:hypothetical protein [Candidatus Acidoferrales bacterium]